MPTARGVGPCTAREPCSAPAVPSVPPALPSGHGEVSSAGVGTRLAPTSVPALQWSSTGAGGSGSVPQTHCPHPVQNRQGLCLTTSHTFLDVRERGVPPRLSSSRAHAGESRTHACGEKRGIKTSFSHSTWGCSVSSRLLHGAAGSLHPVPPARPVATSLLGSVPGMARSVLAHGAVSSAAYSPAAPLGEPSPLPWPLLPPPPPGSAVGMSPPRGCAGAGSWEHHPPPW